MDNSQKKIYIGMKRVLLYGLLLVALGMQGQVLQPYPTDTVDGKVYYLYTVEKSVGLYRISKNFGVSQEEILLANPELKERGLRFEEVIRIPVKQPVVQEVRNVAAPATTTAAGTQFGTDVTERTDAAEKKLLFVEAVLAAKRDTVPDAPHATETATLTEAEQSGATELPDSTYIGEPGSTDLAEAAPADTVPEVHYTDTVRLAYLLPLHADMSQRNPTMDRFFDFYAGSLLALKHHDPTYVDSTGQMHATYYDVQTYDVGKDARRLCQLLDSGKLVHRDVIIGPAYYPQVKAISAFALDYEIPVIVPFQQVLPGIKSNPYLMKFNPSEDLQVHALMEHLDTLRNRINIVLVDAYANKADYSTGIRKLRDSIEARGLPTTHTTIRHILADSLAMSLKDSVENLFLFHSERYSNVQLLMPYLLSGKGNKQLTVLGLYAWQSERVLLPLMAAGVFRTPEGEAAARYERDFAQYFGHTLSSTQPRYDLLGYDLTNYTLEALKTGTFQVPDTTYEGIQSSILFKQIENGGYENTHIVIDKH